MRYHPSVTRMLGLLLVAACGSAAPAPGEPRAASALAGLEAARDLDGALVGHATSPTLVISFASWCVHCHAELAVLAQVRAAHPELRILGINYLPFETYGQRGGPRELRAYLAANAPWLRVVPVDDPLFDALGHPPKVPTLFVFDAHGQLAARFDRGERAPPDAAELDALLRRI